MPYSIVDAKPIGDLCQVFDCEHKTAPYIEGSPYLVIRTNNVKNGKIVFDDIKFTTEAGFKEWTVRTIPKYGDVLFTREAPAGEACLVPAGLKICMGQRMVLLRPKRNTIDHQFLSLYLATEKCKADILRQSIGSTVSRINIADIKKLKIAVPPLPEQIKIAEILSTWDNAINTVQKLLANSQQQKKALMQKLLTGKKRFSGFEGEWESVRLSKIANVSIGLVTTMTKFYVNSGVPLIRNSDIKPNRIQKNNMVFLCKDFAFENKHRRLVRGDIVTVHTGEVGVSAIINDDLDGCLGFATLNTRPNLEKVTSEYLCWYFNSSVFINWSIAISTGDGRQNLNLKDFVKAQILLPSIEEQQKIATILTTADQEIDNLCAQLNHLKQEKKALMQQLLTGKRRVKIEEAA